MIRLLTWLFPFKKPLHIQVQEDMRAERGTRKAGNPTAPQNTRSSIFIAWWTR